MTPEERRRARRDVIRKHHPDRGGDPEVLDALLRRLDGDAASGPQVADTVVVRRSWRGRLAHRARALRRSRRFIRID